MISPETLFGKMLVSSAHALHDRVDEDIQANINNLLKDGEAIAPHPDPEGEYGPVAWLTVQAIARSDGWALTLGIDTGRPCMFIKLAEPVAVDTRGWTAEKESPDA